MDEPDKEKTTKKPTTVRSLITDFCGYTSAVGPGRIHDGKYIIQKIAWSLLFIGAITAFTIQIIDLYKKFEKRPLATNVKIIHDTSLNFPSITICNFNSIRQSQLHLSSAVKEYFEEFSNPNITAKSSDSNNSRRKRRATEAGAASDGEDYYYDDDDYDDDDYDDYDDDPSELEEEFVKEEKLYMFLASEETDLLEKMGHTFEDLVYQCTFRGVSCKNFTTYWTTFWHYQYGNCYRFNGGTKKMKLLKSNKAGPTHGLVLELNVEQSEYIGALTQEAGVKLDISKQGEMAFPLERGLSIAPGFETSIGIRKVDIKRKDPFEDGRCAQTSKVDKGNLYRIRYGASYSATACKESCLAYNQLSHCKCMEYRFPFDDAKIPVCDNLNTTTATCLGMVQKMFKLNQLNCSKTCRPPCNETYFKKSTSFAVWPSETYENYLKESDSEYANSDASFRSSLLKIKLFYEELNFEAIEEERSYELVNFVSDFGGQLGLWIGFSVLTAAEFLELLLLILHYLLKKCLASERRQSQSGNEQDSDLNEVKMINVDGRHQTDDTV